MKQPTILVLGGSAGVGRAIVEDASKFGCRVIATHRGKCAVWPTCENLIGDCGSSYEAAHAMTTRVAAMVKPSEVKVVVHSMASASVGEAMTRTRDQVERTFNVLAHSFLWWVRALWTAGSLSPQARIIALTSPLSSQYVRNSGVIGPAKAALEAYVRVLAAELGVAGVRVNALSFGAVKTESFTKVAGETNFEGLQHHLTPGRAMQTPEDVAKIVRCLTMRECDWINGAVIDASGGMVSRLMDYAYANPPKV
jgi:NAD(P)-dependent dehydrogenase (short-subunit alcohol dehydrogenase family)